MAFQTLNQTANAQLAKPQTIGFQDLHEELAILDAMHSLTILDGKASFDEMDVDRQNWYVSGMSRMIIKWREMVDQLQRQDMARSA